MSKKKLKKSGNLYEMTNEGNLCYCPFQQPIPFQNSINGSITTQKQGCNSLCALFDAKVEVNNNGHEKVFLNLRCSPHQNVMIFDKDNIIESKKDQNIMSVKK